MIDTHIITGILLDEETLTLTELAQAVAVAPDWVVEHVEAGILCDGSVAVSSCRFSSHDLRRARRILDMERHFDAAPELAALVADLLEERDRLRGKLKAAGLSPD